MYDRDKVDFTDAEHARAAQADSAVEGILVALGDGFQPIQDLPVIGISAWAFADLVRTTAQEFYEKNGHGPSVADIAELIGTYFVMLNRDNRWLPRRNSGTVPYDTSDRDRVG